MNPDAGYWWRYSKNVCVKVKFGNIKISSRAILARQSIGQSRRQEKANDTSQHLVCCLCCSLEQGPRQMYSDGGFFKITLSLRISRRVNPSISYSFSIICANCNDLVLCHPPEAFNHVIGSKTRTNQWKILVLGRECMRIWISFSFRSSYSALRCEHSPGQRPAPHKLSLVQTIMSRRKLRQS